MTEIQVVAASDDNYAMPVAVMARSLGETLAPTSRLVLNILETGIRPVNQARVLDSVRDMPNVEINFQNLDPSLFSGLTPWEHITTTTYARLFIPEIFPELHRVLYLDCDLIAVTDITPLWQTLLGDSVAAAAFDAGGSFVNPRFPELWKQLDIPAETRLYNAGVCLMNNSSWAAEQLHKSVLEFLRRHPDQLGNDQDAINGMIWRRMTPLDIRWNQQGEAWEESSALTLDETNACRSDPRIIHFSTGIKPWVLGSEHPHKSRWLDVKSRTAFADAPLLEPRQPSARQLLAWKVRGRAAAAKRLLTGSFR